MEKVEDLKRSKKITDVLSNTKVKYVVGTVLLSVLGIALPRIFHVIGGSNAGAILLPMHIAILMAALVFGIRSATIVASSSVLFSYLLTGMPSIARLPYMFIELLIYAVLIGIFSKKYNNYISLISSMVIGRILYAGVLIISGSLLGLQLYGISIIESTKIGLPGIILQIVCIPYIASVLKKGLKLDV